MTAQLLPPAQTRSQETPAITNAPASWASLLHQALTTPGLLHEAYQYFHHYSTGNQLLALWQCHKRQLSVGPLNTYQGWKRLGRQVRKGEKAIKLCMPVTIKRKQDQKGEEDEVFTRFIYRPNWFVLSQTNGATAYELPPIPAWNKEAALRTLGIVEIPFEHLNGNIQGYARENNIAISPLAALPHKTMFHELGHILLGHTKEKDFEEEATPRHLREAEAETVALLCIETLGLDGGIYSRGYVQHWLEGETIPERSAQKIFNATDKILKAGCKETTQHIEQQTQELAKAPETAWAQAIAA
jgi:antirestriction protein ArdC